MLPIALAMLVIVLIAVAVLAYVIWPHRGEDLPYAPQVGRAVSRTVQGLPTLEKPSDAYVADEAAGSRVSGGAHRA